MCREKAESGGEKTVSTREKMVSGTVSCIEKMVDVAERKW